MLASMISNCFLHDLVPAECVEGTGDALLLGDDFDRKLLRADQGDDCLGACPAIDHRP